MQAPFRGLGSRTGAARGPAKSTERFALFKSSACVPAHQQAAALLLCRSTHAGRPWRLSRSAAASLAGSLCCAQANATLCACACAHAACAPCASARAAPLPLPLRFFCRAFSMLTTLSSFCTLDTHSKLQAKAGLSLPTQRRAAAQQPSIPAAAAPASSLRARRHSSARSRGPRSRSAAPSAGESPAPLGGCARGTLRRSRQGGGSASAAAQRRPAASRLEPLALLAAAAAAAAAAAVGSSQQPAAAMPEDNKEQHDKKEDEANPAPLPERVSGASSWTAATGCLLARAWRALTHACDHAARMPLHARRRPPLCPAMHAPCQHMTHAYNTTATCT